MAVPRLVAEWQRNPAGDHVFIALAVAVGLFFKEWRRRADNCSCPSHWRFQTALCMVSCTCLLADAFFEEEFLLATGLWLGIPIFVWLFCEKAVWEKVAFPTFLLVFCLPLPNYVSFHFIQHPLQLLSTAWTAGMLVTSGLEVWFAGTVIHIGAESLQIVEECSGVRFLSALSFLALLLGFLHLRRYLSLRILVFLLAFPLAVLTNVLRLTLAGEIMARYGAAEAMNFIHSDWVLFFYLGPILFLLAVVRLLTGLQTGVASPGTDSLVIPVTAASELTFLQPHIGSRSILLAIVWLLLVGLGSMIATRQPPTGFYRSDLMNLSLCPPGWHEIKEISGVLQDAFTPNLFSAAQHRQMLLESPHGLQARIEIAWWPERRPRNRLIVFHQSILCPKGRYGSAFHFDQTFNGSSIAGSRIGTASGPVILYYWLQSPGILSKSPFWYAAGQYWLELRRRPTDGCFILVAVNDQKSNITDQHLSDLIDHLQITLKDWFVSEQKKP